MRRTYIIFTCCIVLLFVPIYLWQVKGWFENSNGTVVSAPLEVKANAEFSKETIAQLAQTDPVELLNLSLARYRDTVHGYSCVLTKRERVNGKLGDREVVQVSFREQPFSVLMVWKEGHGRAAATLFAVEESREKMYIRPYGLLKRLVSVAEKAPDCSEAKATNRYLINDFGIRKGTERTYTAWKEVQERGLLNCEYEGVQKCALAGNRDCHVITRHCPDPNVHKDPREREEGLTELTLFIDVETGLQVGTTLKAKGELIGEYYFGDIRIDPTFDPKLFTRENLKNY